MIFFLLNVILLNNYNSRSSTFIQVVQDAGQDPFRLNWHACAKRVSVLSQWHRMQLPILRYCKILFHVPPGGYLLSDTSHFSTASRYNSFHAVIDGKIISDFPTKSILTGDYAKVPLIIG